MKRQCGSCLTTVSENVKLEFQRNSDGKIFNICLACGERGFNPDELRAQYNYPYSTVADKKPRKKAPSFAPRIGK